jgi:CheY-like chemotaxis protein
MAPSTATRGAHALAHELANAIGSTLQLAHLARRAAADGSQAAADLDALVGETTRAASLLDELAGQLTETEPDSGTVLVVEDDDTMRGLVARGLREGGLRVVEARSASEALALSATGLAISLVLTDLGLPGVSGGELARAFAATAAAPPVVVMSGSAVDGVAAAAVLAKPFTPDELLGTVREVLGTDGRTR